MSYAAALMALLSPTECHGEKVLRILGGARPVPNATTDSSKAYTLLRSFPRNCQRCSVSTDFGRQDQVSRRAASRFRLAKSPSDEFFCSFLGPPRWPLGPGVRFASGIFQGNPGVADGTLAVMVGALAAPCRAEQQGACPPCTVSFAASDLPGDGSKGFMLYVGSDSL